MKTTLVEESKSLWAAVVLRASHNVFLMGMFQEMTAATGGRPTFNDQCDPV